MPSAHEQAAAWKPRLTEAGYVDVVHSNELVNKLAAEIMALGFERRVADLAAASVVNMQCERDFGLLGSHNRDGLLAAAAYTAIQAWAASAAGRRKAA